MLIVTFPLIVVPFKNDKGWRFETVNCLSPLITPMRAEVSHNGLIVVDGCGKSEKSTSGAVLSDKSKSIVLNASLSDQMSFTMVVLVDGKPFACLEMI